MSLGGDPDVARAIASVRSDATPHSYCVLSYATKTALGVVELGEGSAFDALEAMEDDKVSYALLRVANTRDQESKTVKFVFLTYVGPSVGGMTRGRVGAHKPEVIALVGQSHVQYQTDDKEDISADKITEMLKKASGANYDLGSNAGGEYKGEGSAAIRARAKMQYQSLEKSGNIGPVVFDKYKKDKNAVTPMDLGGRAMVAPPTAAKKNIVVRDEAARSAEAKTAAQPTNLASAKAPPEAAWNLYAADSVPKPKFSRFDTLEATNDAADRAKERPPSARLNSSVVGTLTGVAARLAGLTARATGRTAPPLGAGASQAEVCARMDELVLQCESCAALVESGVSLRALDAIVQRLEHCAGGAPAPMSGSMTVDGGVNTKVGSLAALTLRLEAVAS